MEQDEEELIMLAKGDQLEVDRLKRSSIGEYLNKLKYFINE